MEVSEEPKNFAALPRRYEDTKPALNQAFAHESILEIGQKIFQRTQEIGKKQKHEELINCQEEVWEKAEVYKDECVEKALQEAKQKEEKRVKHLTQQHDKQMKRELSRLEGIVYQKGMEKVYEEKQSGERKLNDVVVKLHKNFAAEKAAAVEAAKVEERGIASNNATKAERLHQQALEEQHNADMQHEKEELENLRHAMLEEMKMAVLHARREERDVAAKNLNEVSANFHNEIAELQQTIDDLNDKQLRTETALEAMEELKNSYVEKLKHTRSAFTAFIEKSRPDFFTGQSDFLIPTNVIEPTDDTQ